MGRSGGAGGGAADACQIVDDCRADFGGALGNVGVGVVGVAVISALTALIQHDIRTARARTPAVRRAGGRPR